MLNAALIGLGYWGKNLARNLAADKDINLHTICDMNIDLTKQNAEKYAAVARVTDDYDAVIRDPSIDAIVIATPIATHFDLAKKALEAKKHVFVEKPLASSVLECDALIEISDRNKLVLMVGHVFEFNSAVIKVKELIDSGEIGEVLYINGQRLNLGRVQTNLNALWSLAPHDISITNLWLQAEPNAVSARGFSYLTNGVEDVVFVTLEYPGNISVSLTLSWLDPRKSRLMTVVGTDKMVVYDDVSLDGKISIHDKGIENLSKFLKEPESFSEFHHKIRNGDVLFPNLNFIEPLAVECAHFAECILNNRTPRTDGRNGRNVVKVLEAAQKSLKNQGERITLA